MFLIATVGPWQIAIVALVVILLFGVGKLSGLGRDLGSSIKEFRRAMKEEDEEGAEGGQAEKQEPPVQASIAQPPAQQAPPPAQDPPRQENSETPVEPGARRDVF
jgi:sec-independent protein translocase protein TatA